MNPGRHIWSWFRETLFMAIAQRHENRRHEWHDQAWHSTKRTVHVAAVCYRVRDGGLEFLLVKTRAGRWTFPKGRVGNDATRADAAAREAYEEAGVHGRVEPLPFTTYLHSKAPRVRAAHAECRVDAHLCRVYGLVAPEEDYRNPTWFSPEKAKRRLHNDRRFHYGSELSAVVDRAVDHIARRLRQ